MGAGTSSGKQGAAVVGVSAGGTVTGNPTTQSRQANSATFSAATEARPMSANERFYDAGEKAFDQALPVGGSMNQLDRGTLITIAKAYGINTSIYNNQNAPYPKSEIASDILTRRRKLRKAIGIES